MRIPLSLKATAAVLAVAACAAPTFAMGPSNQTISPTNNSVVRILDNTGLPDHLGSFLGTGTIVANTDLNGTGYYEILTCDHVISTAGQGAALEPQPGFAFGNSPYVSGASVYDNSVGAIYRGGATGVEDLAVLDVAYGNYNVNNNNLVANVVADIAFFPFSDIGYGNEGVLAAGGYQAQNDWGIQRYLNNTVGTYQTSYTSASGYTYEAALWTVQDPTAMGAVVGTGAGFDGDSGSPWFSSANNGTYYTNNEFAVFSQGVETDGGLVPFNSVQRAVGLTQANVNWIQAMGQANAVPEPASLILIPGAALLLARRRRSARR